ncbi:MAG TPA: MFS transporter [Chthoniobacteraceae bacterium]|jgi:GPH family glycoside/pentoside/hexuronide:cation symporter|nr:MFS transporter [Chthoniobacteraceae bacterium]
MSSPLATSSNQQGFSPGLPGLRARFRKLFESTVTPADRVPFWQKVAYGLGGPVEGAAVWIPQTNLMPVFNVGLGISPAALGAVVMLWRAWDACADLVTGNLSDNARTRWGRRRPFIVLGALLTGLTMPLIWWAPQGMGELAACAWILISGMIFYACFSLWAMPYYSLQLEMTPDYNERTNVTAYRAFAQQIMNLLAGWVLALAACPLLSRHADHSPDLVNGMRYISIALGLLTIALGVLPGLFVPERYYRKDASKQSAENIWTGLKQTFSRKPFLWILAIVFSKTFGFGIVNALTFYLNAFYVCRGDIKLATAIAGVSSTLLFAPNLFAIPLCTWIASRMGKHILLYVTVAFGILGSLSVYPCVTPAHPWLQVIPSLLIGPIGIGLWLVIPSMQADVADYDELITCQRREGSFSAIFSWCLKASNALTSGFGGIVLVLMGFKIANGANQSPRVLENLKLLYIWAPVLFLSFCLFAISRYDLTRERMREIRNELEARRGAI